MAETYYTSKSSLSSVRQMVGTFIEFMRGRGLRRFDSVTPNHITEYLIWCREKQHGGKQIGLLRTFFEWLQQHGLRKYGNPVITRFHAGKPVKRKPRPYTDAQIAEIWDRLLKRGTPMTRAAAAIGEECGTRYLEVSNLRLQDVDLPHQLLFIRLPVKNQEEGWVPFSDKAKQFLGEWLALRPASNLDYLFVRDNGKKLGVERLRKEFKRILCGGSDGIRFDFGFHRFRHTMATTLNEGGADIPTIMAVGRWRSPAAMEGYVESRPSTVRREFLTATTAARQKKEVHQPRVESLDDFSCRQRLKTSI